MNFCCPSCKRDLGVFPQAYFCGACMVDYPIIAGIPDFRVYPDPYIDKAADHAKGMRLAADAERLGLDFAGLVRHYYAITPTTEVSPDQAVHFTAHHLAGVERGRGMIERLHVYDLDHYLGGVILDVGCGTAGFLAAMGGGVGVDIAFRWLIVARQRLIDLGIADQVTLVCACAEFLPFRAGTFDLVTAENVIEHALIPEGVIREGLRVITPDGGMMLRTVNRYAPGPEPHVGLWGVGFLPRSLQRRYVQRIKGVPYAIKLQSLFDLRRIISTLKANRLRVTYPRLMPADAAHLSPMLRRIFAIYAKLTHVVWLRPLLTVFAPFLDVVSRNETGSESV